MKAINVSFAFEPEVWELQGKYVSFGGETYILQSMNISSGERGVRPIQVVLAQSSVPDGSDVTKIDHWFAAGTPR